MNGEPLCCLYAQCYLSLVDNSKEGLQVTSTQRGMRKGGSRCFDFLFLDKCVIVTRAAKIKAF